MNKKKLTVYDLLKLKGKKQIHEVYVNNVEEALAAEEAGMDMIVTAYGMPWHGIHGTLDDVKRIREAAPNTHLMSAAPEKSFASSTEALKAAYNLMTIGCDSFYTNNSSKLIKDLRRENVPVISHVGLVPGNNTWIGGFRAIGKTADEALDVLRHAIELDQAGAIGIEVEVVPPQVAEIITKKVELITISMAVVLHVMGNTFLAKIFLDTLKAECLDMPEFIEILKKNLIIYIKNESKHLKNILKMWKKKNLMTLK